MASVRILVDCVVSSEKHVAGDIVSVSDADKATLLRTGQAAPYSPPPAPAPPPPSPKERVETAQAAVAAAQAAVAAAQAELTAALAAQGE